MPPVVETWSLNHWTANEVPPSSLSTSLVNFFSPPSHLMD